MRVNPSQTPPEPVSQATGSDSGQSPRSSFERILDEKSGKDDKSGKRDADKDARSAGKRPATKDPLPVELAMLAGALPNANPLVAGVAGKGQAVAGALPIDQIVAEIVAVAPPDGAPAVDIQFDSKALDGLSVRVSGDAEGISIRFAAASEQTAALLARNVEQLTQALEAKGLQVAAVEIQRPVTGATAGRETSSRFSRDSDRGGRQQGDGSGQQKRRQ